MKRTLFLTSGLFLGLLAFQPFVNQTLAADCLAIRKQIEAETDILKLKELAHSGISDCPNDPIINFEYAYSMERFRKYREALKYYQLAAKLAPKYAKSYFGMGDMYMNLESPRDAAKAYQAGLSLQPDDKRAQNSLAEAQIKSKEQSGGKADIAPFINPLVPEKKETKAATKAGKPRAAGTGNPLPYEPGQSLIMQKPGTMDPITAHPVQAESLQQMEFDKAGHSDVTGSLDDKLMGAD
ncbi:MAG: tetratricopeptide repeat protein [Desulfurivibrionaceae bacterium]|nr:tetratricopeptide repeat protein [Desulfurivibrionaceae bacterium]